MLGRPAQPLLVLSQNQRRPDLPGNQPEGSSSSSLPIWKLATAAYYSKQQINMFGFGGPTCALSTSGLSSSRFTTIVNRNTASKTCGRGRPPRSDCARFATFHKSQPLNFGRPNETVTPSPCVADFDLQQQAGPSGSSSRPSRRGRAAWTAHARRVSAGGLGCSLVRACRQPEPAPRPDREAM